jgi:hypothetical protein
MWKEDGGLVCGTLFAGESILLIRYTRFPKRATIYDVLAS